MNDAPLPQMPQPPESKPHRPKHGMRISRYNPRARRLCFDCCQLIHALGIESAPYPRVARWRLASDTFTTLLCDLHKEDYTG